MLWDRGRGNREGRVRGWLLFSWALVCLLSTERAWGLVSCETAEKELLDCAQSNPRYRRYADLLYDCDDYATYCHDKLKVPYVAFSCTGSSKKKPAHAINRMECEEAGVAMQCLWEPQTGAKIVCWPSDQGRKPPKGRAQQALCESIGGRGNTLWYWETDNPARDATYDTLPRWCSDKKARYDSCWNCCLTEANQDGRGNIAWLNHCKYYCWGKPGTPAGPPPVPRRD